VLGKSSGIKDGGKGKINLCSPLQRDDLDKKGHL
jgi:hypothetical protein